MLLSVCIMPTMLKKYIINRIKFWLLAFINIFSKLVLEINSDSNCTLIYFFFV